MRTVAEVENMVYDNNMTVAKNSVERLTEVKDVNRAFQDVQAESDQRIISVYQKKKGKPTKKVTAFAIYSHGHFFKIVYAMLTSDTELRELIRNAVNS